MLRAKAGPWLGSNSHPSRGPKPQSRTTLPSRSPQTDTHLENTKVEIEGKLSNGIQPGSG